MAGLVVKVDQQIKGLATHSKQLTQKISYESFLCSQIPTMTYHAEIKISKLSVSLLMIEANQKASSQHFNFDG